MKRDMDLVRELLLKIADAQKPPDFGALVSGHKEGTPQYALMAYHMHMLIEEVGLVRGIDVCSQDGEDWLWRGVYGSGREPANDDYIRSQGFNVFAQVKGNGGEFSLARDFLKRAEMETWLDQFSKDVQQTWDLARS